MQPRSQLSARAALDLLVYSPVDWPGKTVRLEPDSAQSHAQRVSSGVLSVAELYHANSRLGRSGVQRLLAARTDSAELRGEVIQRSAASVPHPAPDDPSPPERLLRLLRATRDAAEIDLFYGLELRLVHDGGIYAFEPLNGRCALVARLTDGESAAIETALRLLGPGLGGWSATGGLVLVVGRLGRNDALYGARGYRRALIEAGRMSQELLRQAREAGIGATLITEFGDEELDRAALADGVEDGCLAVIELEDVPA